MKNFSAWCKHFDFNFCNYFEPYTLLSSTIFLFEHLNKYLTHKNKGFDPNFKKYGQKFHPGTFCPA